MGIEAIIEAVQENSKPLPALLAPASIFVNVVGVLGEWATLTSRGVKRGEESLFPTLASFSDLPPTNLEEMKATLGRWAVLGILGMAYMPENAPDLKTNYNFRWTGTVSPTAPLEAVVTAFNAAQQGYYTPVFIGASEMSRGLGITKGEFEDLVIAAAKEMAPGFVRIAEYMNIAMAQDRSSGPQNQTPLGNAEPESAPLLLETIQQEDGSIVVPPSLKSKESN